MINLRSSSLQCRHLAARRPSAGLSARDRRDPKGTRPSTAAIRPHVTRYDEIGAGVQAAEPARCHFFGSVSRVRVTIGPTGRRATTQALWGSTGSWSFASDYKRPPRARRRHTVVKLQTGESNGLKAVLSSGWASCVGRLYQELGQTPRHSEWAHELPIRSGHQTPTGRSATRVSGLRLIQRPPTLISVAAAVPLASRTSTRT